MAQYGLRLLWEPVRKIARANIPMAYDLANTLETAGGVKALQHPARFMKIDNRTDKDMMFSIDGVNDHFMVPGGSSFVLDIASNKQNQNSLFLGKGEVMYIEYIDAPTTGYGVYMSVGYGKGD